MFVGKKTEREGAAGRVSHVQNSPSLAELNLHVGEFQSNLLIKKTHSFERVGHKFLEPVSASVT